MGYEDSAGLNVHNHYGPRVTGGEQGVFRTAGANNEYVINLPMSGLDYKFPVAGGVYVYLVDKTFVEGTVSAVSIGSTVVTSASEASPVYIPTSSTGVVSVTGGTGGTLILRYKNVAEAVGDRIDSVDVEPATASVVVAATKQLTASVAPSNADQRVTWTSSDATKATVSSSGLVTGVAAGSATITAKSVANPDKTDTCTVTVTSS